MAFRRGQLLTAAELEERLAALGGAQTGGTVVLEGGLGKKPGTGEPTVDDSAAIQSALNFCKSEYGGGRVVAYKSHRVADEIVVPPGVSLEYSAPPQANYIEGEFNLITSQPALWFTSSGYLTAQHSLRRLLCLPAGFTPLTEGSGAGQFDPDTMRAALDLGAGFSSAGNPIRIVDGSGSSPRPEELIFSELTGIGFNKFISTDGGTRLVFERVWGDSNSLIHCVDSGGYCRVVDMRNRLYATSGVRGTNDLQMPVISSSNVGSRLAVTFGPSPSGLSLWQTGRYYATGDQVYYGGYYYRAYDGGTSGATAPTHTSGRASDGGVVWSYKGAYTGTLYTPDEICGTAYGGTGFLAAGDPIFLKVAPRECYTGNSAYPHYSTVGAPADIASAGGDILDPSLRGRYIVYGIQSVSSSAATVILDCPYDAGLAAAITSSTRMMILPGSRVGTALQTDNVDTCRIDGCLTKGSRFSMRLNGSGANIAGWNNEAAAAGENDAGEFGSIALITESTANRFSMTQSIVKSMGTLIRWGVSGRNAGQIATTVLRGAEYRTIDVVSGALDANVVFEGSAAVHSRSSANHLSLYYRGTVPAFSGDGSYMDRISQFTVAPASNTRRQEWAMMGGRGGRIGVGLAQSAWVASTVYAVNDIAWNTIASSGDQFVYRVTARTGANTSGTVGPQGTTVGATETEGDLTWICVGPYIQGWTGLHVDGAAGTTKLKAQASGADAPDVLCVETSSTSGRGVRFLRGAEWAGDNTANPGNQKGLTGSWTTDKRWRWKLAGTDGTNRNADMDFGSRSEVRAQVDQGVVALGSVSGSIASDGDAGNVWTLTLNGNGTLANPSNLKAGASYCWIITQDGTGSRTLAFGTTWTFSGSSTVSTAAGAVDMISAVYDGSKLRAALVTAFA